MDIESGGGIDLTVTDARYLKLDQASPQSVDGGAPIFLHGVQVDSKLIATQDTLDIFLGTELAVIAEMYIKETNCNTNTDIRGVAFQTVATNLMLLPGGGGSSGYHVVPGDEGYDMGNYTSGTKKARWRNIYLTGKLSDGTHTVTMGDPLAINGGICIKAGSKIIMDGL